MRRLASALGLCLIATSAAAQQQMSLIDLSLDVKSLYGKTVSTSGFYWQMDAEHGFLHARPLDTNSMQVDVTKLPRDQRKALMEKCPVSGRCTVSVTATVTPGLLGPILEAKAIRIN